MAAQSWKIVFVGVAKTVAQATRTPLSSASVIGRIIAADANKMRHTSVHPGPQTTPTRAQSPQNTTSQRTLKQPFGLFSYEAIAYLGGGIRPYVITLIDLHCAI